MSQPQNQGDFDDRNDPLTDDGLADDLYMDDADDPLADMDQPLEAGPQDNAAAKKSKMLTWLIIGVGGVIGLGLIYSFLSGGSQPTPVEQPVAAAPATPLPADTLPTDPMAAQPGTPDMAATPPETGGLPLPPAPDMVTGTDPALPATPDALATLPPAPEPVPADPNQILATELPALTGTEAAPVLADTPAAPAAEAPAIAVGEPNPATPETAKVEAPQADTASNPAAPAAELAALAATLEKIDERLQALEGRLDTQSETQAKLAEDINALKSNMAKAPAKAEDKPVIEEVSEEPAAKPAPKKAAPQKKKRELAPEDKAYVPPPIAKKPPAPVATPATNTVTDWQLRGAAQGKAWVAKAGSSELLVVSVGDTLPGLGVISSITNTSGKWVVQGQTGRIE